MITRPYHLVGGQPRTLCGLHDDDPQALPYGHYYYVGRRKVEPDYCPKCLHEHHLNEGITGPTPDPWPDILARARRQSGAT